MFSYSNNDLYCEQVALADVAAQVGTPAYVYSSQTILANYRAYDEAFGALPHTVCYAVKANSSLAVLALLAKAGAGFDIVSGGELARVLAAGGDPSRVVFSGVGKTAAEVEYALDHGIHSFNCESEPEMALLDAMAARRGVKAGFSIRVNPDVDAATHPYIATGLSQNKFGIAIERAHAVYRTGARLRQSFGRGRELPHRLADSRPEPAAGSRGYAGGTCPAAPRGGLPDSSSGSWAAGSASLIGPAKRRPRSPRSSRGCATGSATQELTVMVEPGRSIVGPAGVLLTRVLYRKQNGSKEFIVVDAAMNDLIRPALYHAHHEIVPLRKNGLPPVTADVVGPICESGDFLARDRLMANAMPGDYLAVCAAGAYGFVQSSNYNSRPRAPEVLVEGAGYRVIRQRETYLDLMRGETI